MELLFIECQDNNGDSCKRFIKMENPVLQSIEPVIKNSEHVRINEDKIREFAESFSQKGFNNTK